MDLNTVTEVASNPYVFGGLILGLEFLLRKVPKAKPILQIVSGVALFLDRLIGNVPGLKNQEEPKK